MWGAIIQGALKAVGGAFEFGVSENNARAVINTSDANARNQSSLMIAVVLGVVALIIMVVLIKS